MDFYEAFGGIAALLFIALIVYAIWAMHSQWKEEEDERKASEDEMRDELASLKAQRAELKRKVKGGNK